MWASWGYHCSPLPLGVSSDEKFEHYSCIIIPTIRKVQKVIPLPECIVSDLHNFSFNHYYFLKGQTWKCNGLCKILHYLSLSFHIFTLLDSKYQYRKWIKTSTVVQCSRICLQCRGHGVPILGQDPTWHSPTSPCATTTEPTCLEPVSNNRSHANETLTCDNWE